MKGEAPDIHIIFVIEYHHIIHRRTILLDSLEDAHFGDQLMYRYGCPAYISPEMLQPGSYSGSAVDMWSLGVTLYSLLVGYYPFYGQSPQELFARIRCGSYYIPEHVSFLARSLIGSLLSYQPQRRPSAWQILEHPWFKPLNVTVTPMNTDQLVPGQKRA